MIDKYGLIVDQTGDGGDSCNFTCTALALGSHEIPWQRRELFWQEGRPVRHPFQQPWDNPKNFSRDQAIPLMQVMEPFRIKYFLEANPWFFPNTERDSVGSTKHPRPHWFINDHGDKEFRWFDFADPMTPDFMAMCFSLCGKKDGWLYDLGVWWCRKSIEDHCSKAKEDKSFVDFKQLYFTAKALGLQREFGEQHPWGLHYASWKYFTDRRSLRDIDELFLKEFQREGIKE